jgi:hypothetical protein
MKLNIVLFFLFSINLYFLPNKTFAQPKLWEIYTTSDQPYINVIIDKYEADSLYLKYMDQLIILHQDSIKYILHRNESNFGAGFLFGALAGGIIANLAYREPEHDGLISLDFGRFPSTIAGVFIGGTFGGLAGAASGADNKYRIDRLDSEDKRKLLNRLFN